MYNDLPKYKGEQETVAKSSARAFFNNEFVTLAGTCEITIETPTKFCRVSIENGHVTSPTFHEVLEAIARIRIASAGFIVIKQKPHPNHLVWHVLKFTGGLYYKLPFDYTLQHIREHGPYL